MSAPHNRILSATLEEYILPELEGEAEWFWADDGHSLVVLTDRGGRPYVIRAQVKPGGTSQDDVWTESTDAEWEHGWEA